MSSVGGKRTESMNFPQDKRYHACWDEESGTGTQEAIKHLKGMARLGDHRWGKINADEIKHFFQRLSVSLQRGNAALLFDLSPADI